MQLFERKVFFDAVRKSLFGGVMSQDQVDGMSFKLNVWEAVYWQCDLRWCGYAFATSYHETGKRMVPVREGFKETDAQARAYVQAQGYAYAVVDPVTGEVYYGRGDIQTTWAENYKKVGEMIGMGDALYRRPDEMLEITVSASSLFEGMKQGIYRGDSKGRQTLERYFSETVNDPFNAREIVNGDKNKVPSWSGGVSIGNLIKGYHQKFMVALEAAAKAYVPPVEPGPDPEPPEPPDLETETVVYRVTVTKPIGIEIGITLEKIG